MIVERQTIPHLNAQVGVYQKLEEQLSCSIRGCHTAPSLKSIFFRRKVAWQPLMELHSWAWDILKPTSRATKWSIICFYSLTVSLGLGHLYSLYPNQNIYLFICSYKNTFIPKFPPTISHTYPPPRLKYPSDQEDPHQKRANKDNQFWDFGMFKFNQNWTWALKWFRFHYAIAFGPLYAIIIHNFCSLSW